MTYEALGREVDHGQTSDLDIECTSRGNKRLDGSDHLVRGLTHGPDDTEEEDIDCDEERAEGLHRGEEGYFVEAGEDTSKFSGMWNRGWDSF